MKSIVKWKRIFSSLILTPIIAVPLALILGYILSVPLYELAVSDLPEPQNADEAVGVGESQEVAYWLSCAGSVLLVFCVVTAVLQWIVRSDHGTEDDLPENG